MSDRGPEHEDESENQNKEEDKMDATLAYTPHSPIHGIGTHLCYNGRQGGNRMTMEAGK